jgi:hypothetical protein
MLHEVRHLTDAADRSASRIVRPATHVSPSLIAGRSAERCDTMLAS